MSNSGLSNRRVRSLPKKMTRSAQPHFLTVQSPEERFKPLDQVYKGEILVETLSRIPFSLPSLRCARPIRQIVQECLPLPPVAGVSGMDLRLLYVQYLAHDDHQNFN